MEKLSGEFQSGTCKYQKGPLLLQWLFLLLVKTFILGFDDHKDVQDECSNDLFDSCSYVIVKKCVKYIRVNETVNKTVYDCIVIEDKGGDRKGWRSMYPLVG